MKYQQPHIEIDEGSGFCFGVVSAIRKAEEVLASSERLYCLGDIVHNSDEVERLREKGLITITHEELAQLRDIKVLLRAHGEPPSTYEIARRNNIEIIDATCPVVLQLQRRIKATYETDATHPQIVIYGKAGHAEVNGLVGQTGGEAIVVEDESQLDRLDPKRDIMFYSQTTKSPEGFADMIAKINHLKAPSTRFEHFDTICRQVSNRVNNLRTFAAAHDVVLFVSGVKSSNGRVLYNECRKANPASYLIANKQEIQSQWLQGATSIGICGATSTPRWLMEEVRDCVAALTSSSPTTNAQQ
ncbi:MAG: 4-hydroxy-3-methylbut-2-enyl diphosphate reductase [Bacteroidales bacterium]|nr:4-hydroxy-3-methylbut-2-enyl diphosphate reductase [Bacteroidales bacterium]